MQSAAKNPIFISFYCKKFEGPDKFFKSLLREKGLIDNNEAFQDNIDEIDECCIEEDIH